MLEVSASLEEGSVLRAVPKGRVNPPVHITSDSDCRTKIIVDDKNRHLETP